MKKPILGAALAVLLILSGCFGQQPDAESSGANNSGGSSSETGTESPDSSGMAASQPEDPNTTAPTASDAAGAVSASEPGDRVPLESLPQEYTLEMAEANGDVVSSPVKVANLDKLSTFLDTVNRGKKAYLRVASWGIDDGPFLIEVDYDGNQFYAVHDNTRSKAGGNRVEKVYESVKTESSYNEATKATITRVYLIDSQGRSSQLCQYSQEDAAQSQPQQSKPEAVLPGDGSVQMETGAPSYNPEVRELKITVRNGSGVQIVYGEQYTMEMMSGGDWELFEPESEMVFNDVLLLSDPGGNNDHLLNLGSYPSPLPAGKYRVVKTYHQEGDPEGTKQEMYAEFSVVEPQEGLKIERPLEIEISIGNGKNNIETTLTRKQKYKGRSPVSFVMTELAKFQPVPSDWKLSGAAAADGGRMEFRYADGETIELLVDPNSFHILKDGAIKHLTVIVHLGVTYYSDEGTYQRLQDCAAKIAERQVTE